MVQQYPWKGNKPWNDYSTYINRLFSERVQKISLDAGFTCPNRDGTKGIGGCIYCNNDTFNPFYCEPTKSISHQLKEGIQFFAPKYSSQKYLAYFQAYTNTYALLEELKKLYSEALNFPSIVGLVISTRPDCIDEAKLDYLQQLAEKYYIVLEYGLESCHNETLARINRGHTFEDAQKALEMSSGRGIHIGIHMILGLPCETQRMILENSRILSGLPFETLKLHQLQIIKNTLLAKQFEADPNLFHLYSSEEYIELVIDFIELLNPEIIIERFISESPLDMLIAPRWNGLKNFEIVAKIEKKMKQRQTWQGKLFNI
jgi:uncharacterized protein